MRTRLGAVLIALLMMSCVGCSVWSEKKVDNWKSATKSESLNKLFWDEVAAGNWQSVQAHVAPLAVFKDGENTTTGVGPVIEMLKSAKIKSVQVGDVTSQPAGADMVTTYTLAMDGRAAVKVLTVWQPANKTWVIVANSATLAQR